MKSIDSRWIRSAVTVFVALFFISALPWRELRADAITHGEYDCSPLSVTYDQVSTWDTTTQAEFTVTNTSDLAIEGWTFELEFPIEVSVSNIWNAVDLTGEEPSLVVGNQEYNSTIAPGESITFGIILEGTEFAPTAPSSVTLVTATEEEITEIPEEITDEPCEEPVESDAFSYAVFTSGDISISGYMSNIYGDIYSGTNFIFQGSELNVEGTVRTAGSVNASGYITEIDSIEENIESIEFPDLEEYIAESSADKEILSSEAFVSQTDIVANGYYYTEDCIEINAATLSGEVVIVSEEDITINVDTIPEGTNLILYSVNGDIAFNVTEAEINGIFYDPEGKVTVNANEVSVIGNIVANELEFNGSILNISVDEDVVFPTVTPTEVPEITVTDTPTETPEPTTIPTEEPEVTDTPTPTVTVAPSLTETPTPTATATPTPTEVPIDTELDSDGDYIPDYLEVEIGTNPNNTDSDADGLNDYMEIMVGYDPTKADTDGNGIDDGDEDLDGDNVSNLVELSIGTEMMSEDTDCDGITDGNELYVYCSNPMNPDTDGDGIYDGDELLLGKSPTDSSDGDIRVEQTKEQEFSNEEDPAISSVEVTMELSNIIDRSLRIRDMYNVNVYVTNVAGRIGSPISFECAEEFDTATVVIHYDETQLGDTQEDDLGVLWFDEANGIFVEQEQAVVDTDVDTVTLELEHFSTYVVVDRSIRNSIRPTVYTIDEVSEPEEQHYDVIFAVNAHQGMTYDERVMAIQCIENVIGQLDEEDRYAFVLIGEGLVYSYYSFYSYGDGIPWKIRNDILRYSFNNYSPTYYRLACAGAHAVYENVPGSDVGNKTIILAITDEYISSTNVGSQYWLGHFITADWYTAFIPGTYCEDVAEDMYSHGGEWYSDCTKADIGAQIIGHEEAGIETISYVDEDEDGLPDVLEEEGMYVLNSDRVYYSDPTTPDSDMDTLTDGEEMGTMHRILRIDEDTVQIDRIHLFNVDEVGTSEFSYLESYIPENPNEICFVFDVVSDPMLKDTDGDFYWDKVDPNPMESDIITINLGGSNYNPFERDAGYIHVREVPDALWGNSRPVNDVFYGGDQNWFGNVSIGWNGINLLLEDSGCGLIATNDVTSYYNNGPTLIDWDDYYNSVLSVNDDFIGVTISLGLFPIVHMNNSYCVSPWFIDHYFNQHGHSANDVFVYDYSSDTVLDMLCGSIASDQPVIILTATPSSSYDLVLYEIPEETDDDVSNLIVRRGSVSNHYMTITGILYDYHKCLMYGNSEPDIYLRVQSWGTEYYVKYNEYVSDCSNGYNAGHLIFTER